MGYYIQAPSAHGKAEYLAAEHAADILGVPPASYAAIPEDKALIAVVDNGLFEAAAYVHSEPEFTAFSRLDDPRPRTWLLMDKTTAQRLSNYP